MSRFLFSFAFVLPSALIACSGNDTSASATDATAPSAPEASPGDAPVVDALADAGGCTQTLAAYCAAKSCPDYATASHPAASPDGGPPICLGANSIAVVACGAYVDVSVSYLDNGTSYYFDATTHALVAVVDWVVPSQSSACVGGPPDFVLPGDCSGTADFDPGCACGPEPRPYPPAAVTARAPVGACTDEQIDAFLGCVPQVNRGDAGAGCDRFLDAGGAPGDRACGECLLPSSDGGAAGPITSFDVPHVATNVSGCIALATGDTTASGCAGAYEDALGCALAACFPRCGISPEDMAFDCAKAALAGPCAAKAAGATCLDGGAGSAIAAACGTSAATYVDQYRAVARRFCGAPVDGGTVDASDAASD